MNTSYTAAILAALSLMAGEPVVASAQPGTAIADPIVVSKIYVHPSESAGGGEMTWPGSLQVVFHNTNAVAATDVYFDAIEDGGTTAHFHDTGSFAEGTTIDHQFVNRSETIADRVDVVRVRFADGSEWFKSANGAGFYARPAR